MKYAKLIIFLLFSLNVAAQQLPYKRHRAYAYRDEYFISPSVYDYSPVTDSIVGDATGQYEQARRIYMWICGNVAFDPSYSNRTADTAWDQRKAVCQGYCELFYRMAETQHIRTRLVYGTSLSPVDGEDMGFHVWLVVATEAGDIYVDPTWGAGKSVNGQYVRNIHPEKWFDVPKDEFLITHKPKVKKKSWFEQFLLNLFDD